MNKVKKGAFVTVVLVMAFSLSGCYTWLETSAFDPGKSPYMQTQMHPGWGGNSPTVCYERDSRVGGREDNCRVERGYEDGAGNIPDDDRNWVIDFAGNMFEHGPRNYWGPPGQLTVHPWHSCPAPGGGGSHGCMMTTGDKGSADGWLFEGCVYNRNDNAYACDYRARFDKIMGSGGRDHINYLRATINWGTYVGNAVVCAAELRFWAVGDPLLSECADGPYEGFIGDPVPPEHPDPLGEEPVVTELSEPIPTTVVQRF